MYVRLDYDQIRIHTYMHLYDYPHLNHVRDSFKFSVLILLDIRCDNLSTPANGEITCSSGRVGVGYEGDTCSFTCNTGYELTGSDTRTCQSDGSWSGTEAICIEG